MKKLPLRNSSFRYLERGFGEWLAVLGYSAQTVSNLPVHVRELLYHLETEGIAHIRGMGPEHIRAHYEKLRGRSNQRREGGLGAAHLNKHHQAIHRFLDYLRQTARLEIPDPGIRPEPGAGSTAEVLTLEEVRSLYAVTVDMGHYDSHCIPPRKMEAMASRDRAMLTVFYGCGLRRSEGTALDRGDINFDRGVLHVRKGKGNKERLVPLNRSDLKHLEGYVYDHRRELGGQREGALFLSHRGGRMQGQSHLSRLKWLQFRTGDTSLMDKDMGLHTLRHSIATHLLQAGMPLEQVGRFLGHGSLESTQIYTHLAGTAEEGQPYDNIPGHVKIRLHGDEL